MRSEPDLYAVLGVPPTATFEEIRSAYRSAAKNEHPDRFGSYVQKARANERMRQLNAAYSVLRDPKQRDAYDAERGGRRIRRDQDRSSGISHDVPVASRTAPRPSPLTRTTARVAAQRDWGAILAVLAWVIASGVFAYFWMGNWPAPSPVPLAVGFVLGLFVTPFLFLAVGASLAIPVMIVSFAFEAAFAERQRQTPLSAKRMLTDFTIRFLLLVVVCYLTVAAFRAGVQSDLLYVALLAAFGSLSGELVGMLVYAVRRVGVVRTTTALLRMDDTPTSQTRD